MMYASLAGIYDSLAYDFDYAAWCELYEELLKKNNGSISEICDAGCGTGTLTVALSRKGYRMTGTDLSGDMLSVASDKAHLSGQRITFVKQDMRQLLLPHKVDAVMCACDGVNYLTTPNALKAFFGAVFSNLKAGGAFAFDISNREKLLGMGKEKLYAEETDACAYLWQNEFEDDILKMYLSFYIRAADGRYDKTTETHSQRAWKKCEILDALNEAGFVNVESIGDDEAENPRLGGKRIFFSAAKPN